MFFPIAWVRKRKWNLTHQDWIQQSNWLRCWVPSPSRRGSSFLQSLACRRRDRDVWRRSRWKRPDDQAAVAGRLRMNGSWISSIVNDNMSTLNSQRKLHNMEFIIFFNQYHQEKISSFVFLLKIIEIPLSLKKSKSSAKSFKFVLLI